MKKLIFSDDQSMGDDHAQSPQLLLDIPKAVESVNQLLLILLVNGSRTISFLLHPK